ncbi:MAG: hexose kinase [Firmicutes bacterium]|nr:hexose kinase [Bacillota bacterium]
MITVVSMNPCIDLTLFIPKLEIGGSHRVTRTRSDISGKAVNVAHCLKNLEQPSKLLGFNFIENGNLLEESLDKSQITHDLLTLNGSIRTNIKIFEEKSENMTEINQESAFVSENDLQKLLEKIKLATSKVVILSGSLPTGAKSQAYGDIIRQTTSPTILDTYGAALLDGLSAGAYIIKPNLFELEQTLQAKLSTEKEQILAVKSLLQKYPKTRAVCLSLGAKGAFMISQTEVFFAPPLKIPIKGVQGAGDSLVAGSALILANNANATLAEMLKSATAAATASLMQEGSLMCTKQDYINMLKKVDILDYSNQ